MLIIVECVLEVSGVRTNEDVGKLASMPGAKRHYQCHHCGHISSDSRLIQAHVMSKHLDYKPFACLYCDFRTVKGYYVTHHIQLMHPTESSKKRNYSCIFDNVMEDRLKNGYHLVDPSECAVKLQDHTYNAALSATSTEAASSLCQSSGSFRSRRKNETDNTAVKNTASQKKTKSLTAYRCKCCAFVTFKRISMSDHVMKNHSERVARCSYCSFSKPLPLEIYIHWCKFHQDLPFKYQKTGSDGSFVDVNVTPASFNAMMNEYFRASSPFDDSQSETGGTDVPADKEDEAGISELTTESTSAVPDEVENDVIYCCETCPSSFSTAEALALHKCTCTQKATA